MIFSGRKILFSCEWPLYQKDSGIKPDYEAISKTCHVFRNEKDVLDNWDSISRIIEYYGQNNEEFMKHNGDIPQIKTSS